MLPWKERDRAGGFWLWAGCSPCLWRNKCHDRFGAMWHRTGTWAGYKNVPWSGTRNTVGWGFRNLMRRGTCRTRFFGSNFLLWHLKSWMYAAGYYIGYVIHGLKTGSPFEIQEQLSTLRWHYTQTQAEVGTDSLQFQLIVGICTTYRWKRVKTWKRVSKTHIILYNPAKHSSIQNTKLEGQMLQGTITEINLGLPRTAWAFM